MNAQEILSSIIQSVTNIPTSQFEIFSDLCRIQTYGKGERFIDEGEIPNKFAFNLSGLFRYYYTDMNGNEYTKGFFPERSVLSAYSAMIQNRGSYFAIESLEDSTIAIISYNDWKRLLAEHECWKSFLIAMLEKGYCVKESREREFLLFDAETRYKSFLQNFPGLEKRIKQHYIASYLGITPVALSRIRNKMGIVNIG